MVKLNLDSCLNTKIDISIPVSINDNLDKYNPKSKYYNDICSKTISECNTDITLNDRKNEFIDNNMTLCEENCELTNYDYKTEKVKCSCDIKMNIPLLEEIKFNKEELLKSFIDIKNVINVKILKCFKEVFNDSLKYNYGFFLLLLIILLFIICIIIFYTKSYNNLKIDINDIVIALKYKKIYIKKKVNYIKKEAKNNSKESSSDLNYLFLNKSKNLITQSFKVRKFQNNNKYKIEQQNAIIQSKSLYNKKILEYKDFELNSLKYEEAQKFDKRTYFQFYISLLKIKNLCIFSFCSFKDYNSRIIKIFLFFFFFTIHFTINALFFNDSTMHKIYEDKGSFNFVYQIPQILYSSLISGVINGLISYLSLSQDNIIKLKQEKEIDKIDKKKEELINSLNIKFILFFVNAFIILLFCWYYIACFCGIYVNTQIHLIKDSIISFSLSLIYPIFSCLIPGIFRISALKNEKNSLEFIYKLSSMIILVI